MTFDYGFCEDFEQNWLKNFGLKYGQSLLTTLICFKVLSLVPFVLVNLRKPILS